MCQEMFISRAHTHTQHIVKLHSSIFLNGFRFVLAFIWSHIVGASYKRKKKFLRILFLSEREPFMKRTNDVYFFILRRFFFFLFILLLVTDQKNTEDVNDHIFTLKRSNCLHIRFIRHSKLNGRVKRNTEHTRKSDAMGNGCCILHSIIFFSSSVTRCHCCIYSFNRRKNTQKKTTFK